MNHRLRIHSIIGSYIIVRLIEKGGMGEVYEAFEPTLERKVALKIISEEANNIPEIVDHFKNEGKALAQINHPNIVSIYNFGQELGIEYIAMEYVEGENLKNLIKNKSLDFATSINIFKEILSAVKALHSNNIIHRDLKPHNIIINEMNNPKIVDFGIAKRLNKSTNLDNDPKVMGSVTYLAPELFSGEVATEQSDIWSLGIILFELLTLSRPYSSKKRNEVINEIINRELEFPIAARLLIDNGIQDIFKKMCNKNLFLRYKTINEIEKDIIKWEKKLKLKQKENSKNQLNITQTNLSSDYSDNLAEALQKEKKKKIKKITNFVSFSSIIITIIALVIYNYQTRIFNLEKKIEIPIQKEELIENSKMKVPIESTFDVKSEITNSFETPTPTPATKDNQEKEVSTQTSEIDSESVATKEQTTSLEKVENFVPKAPKWLKSSSQLTLIFEKSSRGLASSLLSAENPPTLSWEKVKNIEAYEIQIASDRSFKKILIKQLLSTNYYLWKNVKPGMYYWRVRSKLNNKYSEHSRFKTMQFMVQPPVLGGSIRKSIELSSDEQGLTSLPAVKFQWTQNPFADLYEFQLIGGKSLNVISKESVNKPSIEIKVPLNKNLRYRVAALDSQGRKISNYSQPQNVFISTYKKPKAPSLKVPDNGSDIILSEKMGNYLAFSWSDNSNFQDFELELSKEADFKKVLLRTNAKNSKFILNKRLPKGKYFWRVRTRNAESSSSWTSPYSFNIK